MRSAGILPPVAGAWPLGAETTYAYIDTPGSYFGARYESSARGRFTSVDPSRISAYASNPQTWNRYSYTLNNPLLYVDPDGKCNAPKGLNNGQVGICLGAFIQAPSIWWFGFGDNRKKMPNDPAVRSRIEVRLIFDVGSREIIKPTDWLAVGKSRVGVPALGRSLGEGLQGSTSSPGEMVSQTITDGNGNTRFSIKGWAKSGVPVIPSIDFLFEILVEANGNVKVSGQDIDNYPTWEGYSYEIGRDPQEIFYSPEVTSWGLFPPTDFRGGLKSEEDRRRQCEEYGNPAACK